MRQMTLRPQPRLRWFARIAIWTLSLVPAVVVFVVLGFAFGAWVAAFTFALAALSVVYAYRRGMRLRRLMEADPAAAFRDMDRRATREGKFYAGVAFATMGVGIVAIIVVFATHA